MIVSVLGMNSKTAAVDLRERFAFEDEALPRALSALREQQGVAECVILSTCNRVELYAVLDGAEPSALASFLCDFHGVKECIDDTLYVHTNEEAVEHLCKVAAGIDSMIVGEPQVFGQVKDAYRIALEAGVVGPVFKRLFPQAFALVKKVRSSTDIGRANVSVSYAAVALSKRALGEIAEKTALILGAGEMAELTVRNLMDNGVKQVFVANRTFERAVRLAESIKGTPIMLYEAAEYIPKTDIVISSIASPGYVISKSDIADSLGGKPVMIIDISVPRTIDPGVKEIPGVHLYNIDDLKAVVEESRAIREREAEKAAGMIGERVKDVWKKLDAADLAPVILSLKDMAENVRQEGFASFATGSALPDEAKGMVESLTKSIVNRIMHNTIEKVRELTNAIRFGS